MPREPTAEEKARMEKGPRYDPSRPRDPWTERELAPTPSPPLGWEERGLQKGWPSDEPIPPPPEPPPEDWDWRAWMATRGAEAGFPPLAPPSTPVIPELGMEAWALPGPPAIPELGYEAWKGRLPPWPERGIGPSAGEVALAGGIKNWGQEYAGQTPIVLPEGFEIPTDDPDIAWQRYDWVKSVAYDESIFIAETGQQLTFNEASRLARTNPEMAIVDVFAIGGGNTVEVDMTLNELFTGRSPGEIESKLSEEATGIKTSVEEQIESQFSDKEAKVLDEGIEDLLGKLDTKMSPEELKDAKMNLKIELYNLYLDNPELAYEGGENPWNKAERKINEALREQGSLQAFAGEAGKEEPSEPLPPSQWGKAYGKYPPEYKEQVTTKVDVGTLQKTLEPYGINLTSNYPYISPMTEAHLMRLSPEVIKEMARYLTEKGLSWQDFLEVSSSWYGGGGQGGRGQFPIPRQW